MRRPKIGDVIEIPANGGYYYGIVTHRHDWGDVFRIIDQRYPSARTVPPIFDEFENFITIQCIFKGELDKGSLRKIGNVNIPKALESFPLFRSGTANHKTGKVEVWWLWDGEKSTRIGDLNDDQKKLPRTGALSNDSIVIHLEGKTHHTRL